MGLFIFPEQYFLFGCSSCKNASAKLLFAVAFALLCTFFSSCVREINGVVSLRGEDPGIVFYVDNYSESARTLAPAALTTDGLIFQIDGEDKDGNPYPLTSVTIDSSGKGRIENVSCSIWNLVMHAYLSAADASDKKDVLREKSKRKGKNVFAVGTTSCRVLESATDENGIIHEMAKETDIFIYPGYKFKMVDKLLTNFHLPESTLIMLVSSLAGKENIMNAYKEAVKEKYRFFSFGDCMLIL